MDLSKLPKTTTKSNKRPGRGYGSGVGGHTSTRGMKGQNARNKTPIWFEGGQLPLIRRLPFIRGKGRFQSLTPKPVEINISQLNQFKTNATITPKALIEAGLLSDNELKYRPLKILGHGELTKALTVKVPTSKAAQAKIEAAGGKVASGQDN